MASRAIGTESLSFTHFNGGLNHNSNSRFMPAHYLNTNNSRNRHRPLQWTISASFKQAKEGTVHSVDAKPNPKERAGKGRVSTSSQDREASIMSRKRSRNSAPWQKGGGRDAVMPAFGENGTYWKAEASKSPVVSVSKYVKQEVDDEKISDASKVTSVKTMFNSVKQEVDDEKVCDASKVMSVKTMFNSERRSKKLSVDDDSDGMLIDIAAPLDSVPTASHITQTRFDAFNISPNSIRALHSILKYERMTEVQEATFPVILKGEDVLARARTGTGKTIAFLLPAIEAILRAPKGLHGNPIQVLIVCPTRELAQQVASEAQLLLKFHAGVNAQVVYGGTPIPRDQRNLTQNPCQILVGTPGRLADHIQRTPGFATQLKSVKLFVLDEADHMLNMGFRPNLEKMMRALPSERQTLLFSATIPKEVHQISKVALKNNHVYIDTVGENNEETHIKVQQHYMLVPMEKHIGALYEALREHISEDPEYKVLVFCTTARVTALMCKLFTDLGFNSREIHSRKDQKYRTRISDEFRNSKGGIILFTSDVSARGVDYPNVTFVIQVGAPSEFEQYIHRLGRTGRAGKEGKGLLLLAPWEDYFLRKLGNLPVVESSLPDISLQTSKKILSTASRIDSTIRERAYQAWIGYYRSLKGITLDKVVLVQYANQFSSCIGFAQPPALSKMLIAKMSLKGVPGIRVA